MSTEPEERAPLPDHAGAARPMIVCDNLVKIYKTAETEVVALQGLDLSIAEAELMAIIGNSGSGKTTLLNIIGGLDRPSAGTVLVAGRALLKFTDRELVLYRRETVGFVWQNNARNLIPYLSALENVELAMLLRSARGRPADDRAGTRSATGTAPRASERGKREKARELLSLVGLSRRSGGRLTELSGGEQQRVAIAIGLANSPRILLADEPTGEVDSRTAQMLLDVLRQARDAYGVTVVIVTHDQRVSRKVDRVVAIRDGRTSSELVRRRSYAEEMAQIGDEETHEELAVVDRAGRLQIPRDVLEAAGIHGQVRVEMDAGRIVLKPPRGPQKSP